MYKIIHIVLFCVIFFFTFYVELYCFRLKYVPFHTIHTIHGVLKARILKVKVKSLSRVQLFVTL